MSSLQSAIHYFLQPLYSDPLVARVQVMDSEGGDVGFRCKVVCGSCGKSVVVTAGAVEEGGEGLRWPTNWDVHLRGHHSSRRLSGSGKDVRSHPYPQNGHKHKSPTPPSAKKRSFVESVSERNRDRPSPHSTTPSPRPPYSPQSPLPPPPPPTSSNPHSPTHLEHLRYLELTEDPSILSLEPYRALCRGCNTWISLGGEGEDGGVRYSVFRWSRHVGGRGCKGLRVKKEKEGKEEYGGGGLEYVSRPLEPIPIRRPAAPSPPNLPSPHLRRPLAHTPSPPNLDLPPPPHLIGSSTSGSMLAHRTLPPLVPSSFPPRGQGRLNGLGLGPRPELALPVIRTTSDRRGEYEVLPPPSIHRQSYSPPSPQSPNGSAAHTSYPERVPKQSSPRLVLSPYPPPQLSSLPQSRSTSHERVRNGHGSSPQERHSPPHSNAKRPERLPSRTQSSLSPYLPALPHPLTHRSSHSYPQARSSSHSRERKPTSSPRQADGSEVYEYRPLVPIPIHPQAQQREKESLRASAREKERGRSISISSLLSSEPSPPSPPSPPLRIGKGGYYREREHGTGNAVGTRGYYRPSPPSPPQAGEYYRSRPPYPEAAEGDFKGREREREGEGNSAESGSMSSTVIVRLEPADEDVDVEMKPPTAVLVPASWDARDGRSRPTARA